MSNNKTNKDKKYYIKKQIILAIIVCILVSISIYVIVPQFIDVKVQKGYKATYETIEKKLSEQDNLEIQELRVYCYWTRKLSISKISASKNNSLPDIDYIYKFYYISDETNGEEVSVYCGYNSETNKTVYFGSDDTYFRLEESASDESKYGEYGSYRKFTHSKVLSDIIEFFY